jgi:predicted nucleic acid-binding protein
MAGEFVDTNVIVYANDPSAGDRHTKAKELMERLWSSGVGALSVQVLQELYVVLTRKVPSPLSPQRAITLIDELSTWTTHVPTAADVIQAARLATRYRISFWDALIVHSAASTGATILWSEDLGNRSRLGSVEVRNPFV